ncbi:hypothetical protein AB0F11_02070 [Streptomyces sp. NPDC032472]|uniref:hypothetical protein n=1 Tax=Streptomyces sp. NPDC032472 TaxID=3155018 RepID=UPI0033E1874F
MPFHRAGGDREGTARAALEADGVFTDEIEAALLAGEIDITVHCLKDTPTHDTPGLVLAAFRPRGDLRDALVHRDPHMILDGLPEGARIGTAAVRRQAYLRRLRPDVQVVPLRGPADERLAALDSGAVDGLILGASGLDRLGLAHRTSQAFALGLNVAVHPGGGWARRRRTRPPSRRSPTRCARSSVPDAAT